MTRTIVRNRIRSPACSGPLPSATKTRASSHCFPDAVLAQRRGELGKEEILRSLPACIKGFALLQTGNRARLLCCSPPDACPPSSFAAAEELPPLPVCAVCLCWKEFRRLGWQILGQPHLAVSVRWQSLCHSEYSSIHLSRSQEGKATAIRSLNEEMKHSCGILGDSTSVLNTGQSNVMSSDSFHKLSLTESRLEISSLY